MASVRLAGVLLIAALATTLAGCSAPAVTDGAAATSQPEATQDAANPRGPAQQAAALVQQRYELVRDGDYEAACALYSEGFAKLFEELAGTEGGTCVEAHQAAADNVVAYLATAADQERAGLTPFFYVPSAIAVDATAINPDGDAIAALGPGTVTSLDPREFEDGAGKTPGWLTGLVYVMRGDDGLWRFIAPDEK